MHHLFKNYEKHFKLSNRIFIPVTLNLKASTLITRAHQKVFKQLREQPKTREDSTTDRPKNKVAAEGQKRHQDRTILPSASWTQPHRLGFQVWAQPLSAHFRAPCLQESNMCSLGKGLTATGVSPAWLQHILCTQDTLNIF